jgi:flagellar protein FliS
MDKGHLQEYAARVSQANRSELVVVIYEVELESIAEAKKLLEAGEVEQCRTETERARGLITELMTSLDMQYGISHYLRQLYIYAYHELCHAVAERKPELFDHAANIFKELLPSFKEVAKQDDSAPLMQNTQQIFAGLTYGKDSLNETIGVGVNMNRGFEA